MLRDAIMATSDQPVVLMTFVEVPLLLNMFPSLVLTKKNRLE